MDRAFRLGPWLVQPSFNTISRNGTTVQLEPKVMSVLVCLADHADGPVSKEKLLQTVWPDTFVGDSALTRCVSELRRVFEDEAKEPRVIQTIAKRGYRLIAPVVPVNGTIHQSGEVAKGTVVHEVDPPVQRRALRLGVLIGVGLAALLLTILGFAPNNWWSRLRDANTVPQIRSLAVLPLRNLSGDPAQEYFAEGMTEELTTELSRLHGLIVISRTSSMHLKNTGKSLPEIASELHVEGIVTGSVLRSGERVRITAHLVQARTDATLWAETYDRDVRDVLELQAAVANAIAGAIKLKMLPSAVPGSKPPRPVNLKAHDAYLRGAHEDDIAGTLSNRRGLQQLAQEHHQKALQYYRLAIQEDPGFARAYLDLTDDAGSIQDAETATRKALEIDDSLPEAHLRMGAFKLVREHNWPGAEREFLRAIELSPSNASAHGGYAYFLDAAGRLDEGMREWERVQELDPAKDHFAGALYSRRQYDRLIELERESFARDPDPGRSPFDSAVSHKTLMVAYARTGRQKESIEEFRQGLIAYGYDDLAEDLRHGFARGGYEGALREWLKGVKKQKPEFPFRWLATYVHTELGERDAAMAALPKLEPIWDVVVGGDANIFPNLVTLRIEPMWDPLHSDPRFDELVRKIGFPH